MSLLKNISIGFILTPRFRAADVVGIQSVLGAHLKNKIYYIADTLDPVYGTAQFPIVPNTTFTTCPHLDVLVVGELSPAALTNTQLIQFVKAKATAATYVIGVSNGVELLGKAGMLNGRSATADHTTLPKLAAFHAIPVNQRQVTVDGKFYTAGPATGAIEAAFMVMQKLRGDFLTQTLELNLEYNPQPLFPTPSNGIEARAQQLQAAAPLKVAVLVPPGLYVPDIMGAVDVLSFIPNTQFFYVWKEKRQAQGWLGPTLVADTTFADCPQVDVVIVGLVPPKCSADPAVTGFFIQQEKQAKAIISICAGTLVCGGAGLLEGKTAVTNFHMLRLLHHVGATPSDKEVEVDGKIYSAGPAIGSYEAAIMLVRDLYGQAVAQHIEQDLLEYTPNPIFGIGSPALAGKLRTQLSLAFSGLTLNPRYKAHAIAGYRQNRPQPITSPEPISL